MIIDGHSLAFRAFYALPVDSFQTQTGQHTNAIHGFIAMLINLLGNEQPDALAVAFDISRHSFRTEEYPEYKGTRGETPPEFKGQIPLLQEALHAMGIRTLEKENYEADDILATLSLRGAEAGYRVLVVSGDRDTIQLVDDRVTLLYPSKQGVSELTRYDAEKVMERYGIRPEQYPEIAALVGETSDNLPGIPRVGEKTAVKWITQFGSLDEILRRRDEIGGKVGESLREHAHLAERNRRLNRLVRDVELDVELDELKRGEIDMHAVQDVFARLEFRTLLQRVGKLAGAEVPSGGATTAAASLVPERPAAKNLIDEELGDWLAKHERPGIQIQELGEGYEVGISTAESSVVFHWLPGGRDYALFEQWLASDAPKVFFDAKQQLALAARAGASIGGIDGDLLIAAWLLRPSTAEKSVAEAAFRFLGEQVPEGDPNQLVPDEESVAGPATLAWYIVRAHDAAVERFQSRTGEIYRGIELPLVPVLAALERRGVQIDLPLIEAHHAELSARVAELQQRAFDAIGREVNLSSPKQLQEVLFEELDMPKTRKTRTGYTTDAAALVDLQAKHPHPFLDALLAHRDANKLRQMVETLIKAVQEDGRVRTTFVQTGSSTGRLASTDPNLQNIPVRSEEGRRIREGFIHSADFETLMTADYSQIEMRIMAHLSGDAGLIQAFNEGEDLHRFVGARIFGVEPAEVTNEMRAKVKAMSYGLAYGLSAFGLSKQLNISAAEAKQLMVDYFERFGGVRDYLRSVVDQAKRDTFTETIFGRRRPFPDLASPNRVLRENAERAALNAPIQGSAADIIKRAMIQVERRMREAGLASQMLLQIHDELMFEVAAGEWDALEAIVREEMAGAAELSVPLEVQVGHGANWNAAAH
ncbi:DNA polymerase I [Leucobacter allii]|uniref:DNA polymerase I n=1 Tax=Leucobacter allii TaxID=2932247 RepID=A0ABY4FRG0_9MICO|nr:DNA polymerase I [Leucobacter allii]UOQ58860.1 DNA polymerase I [Leucobacter allii]UOR02975.1 DNA polymerase I [Leucobacter allii]